MYNHTKAQWRVSPLYYRARAPAELSTGHSSLVRSKHMKAVIMAGGEGSRLRPLTIRRPKPMVPVVDRPAILHIIELLKRHGITEVVITLQYLASVIQEYLGDGSAYGIKIHYTVEESPLGTAGSVRLGRSEEHTSELQSLAYLVCRLLLEKKKSTTY